MTVVTQINEWMPISEGTQPAEEKLVMVSGFSMGIPAAGRWLSLARRVGDQYFADENGEELFAPTHWADVDFPSDGLRPWFSTESSNRPGDEMLVLISGQCALGNSDAGPWVALARRSGGRFVSDETGNVFVAPTHWREVTFPKG